MAESGGQSLQPLGRASRGSDSGWWCIGFRPIRCGPCRRPAFSVAGIRIRLRVGFHRFNAGLSGVAVSPHPLQTLVARHEFSSPVCRPRRGPSVAEPTASVFEQTGNLIDPLEALATPLNRGGVRSGEGTSRDSSDAASARMNAGVSGICGVASWWQSTRRTSNDDALRCSP